MNRASVLIVDDEESIRYTFEMFLQGAGYRVATAAGFPEGIRLLQNHRFDVVFADILLGHKTGLDLLREVRETDPLCPVVLITGAPEVDTAAEAVRLGAYDYIPKPITKEILLRVARMALAMRGLQLEKERYRLNLEAIFNSVREGIVTVDNEMNVLAANRISPSLCCLPDIAPGQDLAASRDCRCTICLDALRECLRERRVVEKDRFSCQSIAGGGKIMSITATPLIDQGKHTGAVLVLRDETRLDTLERHLEERTQLHRLTGKSPAMQRVFDLIGVLADVDTTVLITGESGTGKELVAEALHFAGARRGQPLVKINCSALTESLLESELFGHVKGAFTGAISDKVGRFQAADGGTIFLDEIGDISPGMQVRLLRVLQEREFERVGESHPIRVDVRIIAATHQNLVAKVSKGEFRRDLFYRLKVVGIQLPPLRDRREDLPLLVDQFIGRFNQKFVRTVAGVDAEVMRLFLDYSWPGNIRELEHAIEHGFILCRGHRLLPEHLPAEIRTGAEAVPAAPADSAYDLHSALKAAGGNKAKAARLLGISRRTFYRKMAEIDSFTDS